MSRVLLCTIFVAVVTFVQGNEECDASDSDLVGFKSWQVSDGTLPQADNFQFTVYDSTYDKDCIFIVGGNSYRRTFYCYNITSEQVSTYYGAGGDTYLTTDDDRVATCQRGAVMIDGLIYYIQQDGDIKTIDPLIGVSSETTLTTISGVLRGCLAKHPNQTQLYIQGSDSSLNPSTQFYIYSFDTASYSNGPSLYYARNQPNCIVNEYYIDNPYLYIFTGYLTTGIGMCF